MAHRMFWAAGLVMTMSAQAAPAQGAPPPERVRTTTAIAQAQRSTGVPGSVVLRVPVKLKKMLPEAERVSVQCSVTGDGSNVFGAGRSAQRDIVNGEFDQTIEVVAEPPAGGSLDGATSYVCRLELYGSVPGFVNPHQGSLPHATPYKVARPDAFFKNVIKGPLEGGRVTGGLVGADGLAAPSRRRP